MTHAPLKRFIDRMNAATDAVWVFCGDSITHGALHTFGRRDYVELVEERVRYELGRTHHLFINTAISGDNTAGILPTLEHRALQFEPDFFSLMIGMNDAASLPLETYEENLRAIVERVKKETGAEVLLQTCCAINPEECPGRELYWEYMDACRLVASELDTALIDHHAEWEKVRRDDPERFATWMDNPFHPNALGHWVFAEHMLTELGLGGLEKVDAPG